jgi:ATP-dependent helicase/nuclease subunit A
VGAFLNRFTRWRRLVRLVSLSRCLETILAETNYSEWLLTQARGEQRRANVQRLLGLTQQFDQFQRQGLFRFLRFIEAQQTAEMEPDVAAIADENAVRLMSIHQSKGLEFPIVVLADMGKQFNTSDLKAEIILDEVFGLCPQIKPPHTGKRYPSLPYWLARRRQKQEMLGEELRLLYVAMTRARDTLILSGTVSEKQFNTRWSEASEINANTLLSARNYADWLGLWFAQNSGATETMRGGETALMRWSVCDDAMLLKPESETNAGKASPAIADEATWKKLEERVLWQYAFRETAARPAKASVSSLRRQAADLVDDEAAELFQSQVRRPNSKVARFVTSQKSAADVGAAHHKFLQFVALEKLNGIESLREEIQRLEQEKILVPEEIAMLNLQSLAAFWQSDFGRKILTQTKHVKRELEFTARFSINELAEITGEARAENSAEEFIVVQGTADLVVMLPEEIWLLDFKTDDVKPSDLAARAKNYAPQLKLYAEALRKIYQRPVTECRLHFLALGETVPIELNHAVKNSSAAK